MEIQQGCSPERSLCNRTEIDIPPRSRSTWTLGFHDVAPERKNAVGSAIDHKGAVVVAIARSARHIVAAESDRRRLRAQVSPPECFSDERPVHRVSVNATY